MEKDEIIDNLLNMLKKYLDEDFKKYKDSIINEKSSFPGYKKLLIQFNSFVIKFELSLSAIEEFKNNELSENYIKDFCHRHKLKKEFMDILVILNDLKSIYKEIQFSDNYGEILISKYKKGLKYHKYILSVNVRLNNLIEKIKKDKLKKRFILFSLIRKLKKKEKQQ